MITEVRLGFKAVLISGSLFAMLISLPGTAQTTQQPFGSKPGPSSPAVKIVTRMVTLEVVAEDSKGHHIQGLKADDFKLFEQTPAQSNERREQKIATFQEVSVPDLASQAGEGKPIDNGAYSNSVALGKNPVPPTILLIDGKNTPINVQLQIHPQIERILDALPRNVPIAVFLLGSHVVMLQNLTTDRSLLQAALDKAYSASSYGYGGSLAGLISGTGTGGIAGAMASMDAQVAGADADIRVHWTTDALVGIANFVAGYPGRKNLLWISTSFPIGVNRFSFYDAGSREYLPKIQKLAAALNEAKVTVYPINPAGVHVRNLYTYATMQAMADATGGKVYEGGNDLSVNIGKAVDDSSHFYEIAYYPDSKDWNGEYRRIVLEPKDKDWQLDYRQGYFANAERSPAAADVRAALKQAACLGSLDSSAVLFSADSLPPDTTDGVKFNLNIDASTLTLSPTSGGSEVNLQLAVCTFDKKGIPGQFMSIPLDRKLNAAELQRVTANGLEDIAAIPGPKPASLRMAVMDVPSGKLGSITIKTDILAAETPQPPKTQGVTRKDAPDNLK
jgi:VWFA-related protein